jgi:hypothetical protein
MIAKEHIDKITQGLGIPSLITGCYNIPNHIEQMEFTCVQYTWAVELTCFHIDFTDLTILAAGIVTAKWRRGILILPSSSIYTPAINTYPLKPKWVDLKGQEDRVIQALQNMDHVSQAERSPLDGDGFTFQLEFHNRFSGLHFDMGLALHNENRSFDRLWQAIRDSIKEMIDAYQDPKIREAMTIYLAGI